MPKANEPKRQAAITVAPIDANRKPVSILEAFGLELTSATGDIIRASIEQVPASLHAVLAIHGLKQKLIDAAAISRNPETGLSATVADKWAAVEAVWKRLQSGEWNAARGDGTGSGGLLYKALIRMMPDKTPEQVKAWLEKKTAAEQAALRINPRVAAIIETIRAEQAKADDIDSDALLDQLESGEEETADEEAAM